LATLTCESADNGGDKDLGISDDRIADNVAFPTRSSHGVWQPSFSNYFEKSASLSKPKTWSAAISTLTNEVWRACKTLLLGKRIKTRVLVAASGRSCLTISFNICTIKCAVASYVLYMISFQMCRHSCAKFVIWLQMPLIMLEFCTFPAEDLAAHPACNLGIGIMPMQAQSLYLFTELSDYHKCCKTPDYKYWMPTLFKEITLLQKMD